MKLTQKAISELVQSISLLCDADYVRISHHKHQGAERYSHGELDTDIQLMLRTQSEDFVLEIEHDQQNFAVFTSLLNDHHIALTLKYKPQPLSKEHRRQTDSAYTQKQHVTIELLSKSTFPKWLLNFSQETQNEETPLEQQLLLHLCASTFESLGIFSQFQALTVDALTKLHSRGALQREIDQRFTDIEQQELQQTAIDNAPKGIGLCLIHCRDFQVVNRKFGQAKGDIVLNEIAAIINQQTRSQDIACRFGGALFGIAIHAKALVEGESLAQKLQSALHNRPYLQKAVHLSFNVGVAFIHKQELLNENNSPSSVLIHRAEQALKAAQISDNPSIVQWEADTFKEDEQELNYIGGIFTPDNVTNYRNMLLLWDISSIFADEHEFSRLLHNVIERLACTFEFSAAGIVSTEANATIEQALLVSQMADVSSVDVTQLIYLNELRALANEALEQSQAHDLQKERTQFLLLPIASDFKACFFLVAQDSTLDFSRDATMLFAGFARQLGKALRRSQLEDELNRRLAQQNARLEDELNTLKSSMQSGALVYRSAPMQKIMSQTQRAAQTDTTVLITGESGTGKERLIHAIHNLSPRNDNALIIVDCGSIPETLIESELFGHTKGAFTGANQQSIGKIQAADGGILVLDEIGELPLSMQPKLLRFVQEKQFTPVGSSRVIKVDVKIVAVTNRDLANEVLTGKFRQDLYYRLNVLSLRSPPLRERLEDLPLLCHHFLNKFANQFENSRKFVSSTTLKSMQQYSWPGNIRELENTLMQASLMCENEEILFSDLNIEHNTWRLSTSQGDTAIRPLSQTPFDEKIVRDKQSFVSIPNMHDVEEEEASSCVAPSQQQWESEWAEALNRLLNEVLSNTEFNEFPLGNHLERFIIEAVTQRCQTNKAIASRLRIPVSTARRKKIRVHQIDPSVMPKSWESIASLLIHLAQGEILLDAPLDYIRLSLLGAILAHNTRSMSHAAQLLGVSEPTLYKLKRQL